MTIMRNSLRRKLKANKMDRYNRQRNTLILLEIFFNNKRHANSPCCPSISPIGNDNDCSKNDNMNTEKSNSKKYRGNSD